MTDHIDPTPSRAGSAAREAVKANVGSRSTGASPLLPIILVAAAILSAVYLFVASPDNEPAPTDAMPVPHVQAPGSKPQPAPAPPTQN